jgi:hypothetical protein
MRKRLPPKPLPFGLGIGYPVRITCPTEFRGVKVGLVDGWGSEESIRVWVSVIGENAFYADVHVERGDTIISLLKENGNGKTG